MIDRGERLEVLAEKSETLKVNAVKFKSEAKVLRRQMCWQNYKLLLLCILVILVSILHFAWITLLNVYCKRLLYL